MSYRLKRKRFNCENCERQWNQLVGQDIDSVMCDWCSRQSKVIQQDVPPASHQTAPAQSSSAQTPLKPTHEKAGRTAAMAEKTKSSFEQNLRGAFSESKASNPVDFRASRRGARAAARPSAYASQGTSQGEEVKRPDTQASGSANRPPSRTGRFQNGAYRMVFSNDRMKSQHHNRLNIRDTSLEPSNLFGDQNLPQSVAGTGWAAQRNDDDDLNDRVPDDLPPLEEAHIPHAHRQSRAASRKPQANERVGLRGAAAQVLNPSDQHTGTQPAQTGANERASRQGARRPQSRNLRPDSGARRNIRVAFQHANSMPVDPPMQDTGPGASPFLAELFRQASNQTQSTAATGQANQSSGAQRRMNFNTRVGNMTFSFSNQGEQPPMQARQQNQPQTEESKGLPQMNFQGSSGSEVRQAPPSRSGNQAREERKSHTLPRFNRMQSENVESGPSPFADIFSRLGGLISGAAPQANANPSAQNASGGGAGAAASGGENEQRQNPHAQTMSGIRARSTTFRTGNGNTISVINIGVPNGHPLADNNSMAGPSGLHNVQVGGISMPAPQFVVVHNREGEASGNADRNVESAGPNQQPPQANPLNGAQSRDENSRVGSQIENLVNDLLRNFMDVFNGREFLRMQMSYSGFNPNSFMNNFNQNFASDDLFEMIRRMSEQEAQSRQRSKRAKKSAVEKLPVVKIEEKHCKKQGSRLEPPCCTVCCDNIELKSNGMFMPCGHIYHPDCLNPWLEKNNTCPVCRFDLPLEDLENAGAARD